MQKEMTEKTCPVWLGYGLNAKIRKIIHDPKKMLGKFIEPEMTVADIGTGMGYMTLPMAEMVGNQGKVIAVDIQEKMLSKVEEIAGHRQLRDRIDIVQSKQENLMLENYQGSIDFALMFMMAHEVSNKQQLFNDIGKALKPGGLLMISEPVFHVSEENFKETIDVALGIGFEISGLEQHVNICRTVILRKLNQ